MIAIILILLVGVSIFLIRDNKKIVTKAFMPVSQKVILILVFLLGDMLTRLYGDGWLVRLLPLVIFIFLYSLLTGGLTEDELIVFDLKSLGLRRKIPFSEIEKISYKSEKDHISFLIFTKTSVYKQYFNQGQKKKVKDTFKKNHIRIEKGSESK